MHIRHELGGKHEEEIRCGEFVDRLQFYWGIMMNYLNDNEELTRLKHFAL